MMTRPIYDAANCVNCPCPLTKSFGKWVHHWLYANACNDPTPDPDSIRLDVGK